MAPAGSPRIMEMRGRRVVVTAGAAGIGRAIAEELAAAGARVHVTDISEAAVADAVASVPGLSGTTGDASLARDIDRVLDEVVARFGGLDVLVNNVGVAGPTGGDRDLCRCRCRAHDRRQSPVAFLFPQPLRAAAEAIDGQPVDSRHQFGGGPAGLRSAHAILGDEMGHRRPREVAGSGARAARGSRQRHPARRRRRRPHGGL